MLNIVIVNGLDNGDLELRVNGRPNNGSSKAYRNEDVNWRVDENSNVLRIHSITMKSGLDAPRSTDIFSNAPPRQQGGPQSTHWRGKVNNNASFGAVYNYNINWEPKGGGGTKTYDPKIAVRPPSVTSTLIMAIGVAVVALLSIFTLKCLINAKGKR